MSLKSNFVSTENLATLFEQDLPQQLQLYARNSKNI